MTSLILLSIGLFATTHIDDLLLLLHFFSDRSIHRSAIVAGQYIGVSALLLLGLLGSEVAGMLPAASMRLLGVIPLVIGFSKLPALFGRQAAESPGLAPAKLHGRHMWGVASLTTASGGDNLGVYLPFFATHSLRTRLVIVVVFLVMTAVWCVAAHWLAHHRLLRPMIQRWGAGALPLVLIVLGIRVLFPGS